MWRSWLARTAGGREVAGSSPVIPTIYEQKQASDDFELYLFEKLKVVTLILVLQLMDIESHNYSLADKS